MAPQTFAEGTGAPIDLRGDIVQHQGTQGFFEAESLFFLGPFLLFGILTMAHGGATRPTTSFKVWLRFG